MPSGFNFNPGAVAPPGTYPYSASLSINADDGDLIRVVLAGDIVLLPLFQEQPEDGRRVEIWLMNATTGSVNISFDDAIGVGQNGESQPIVIEEDTTLVVKMRFDLPRNLWSLDGLMDQF